jgi:peptidoglycan/LPS O-acetylase OafA/YrhL
MLQWRFVPDANLLGGASLLIFQAFAVVWAGMAGLRIVPFRIPDLSYGAYIYHLPLIMFIAINFKPQTLPDMLWMLAAGLIPICLLSWYLVEKPALRFKERHRGPTRGAVVAPENEIAPA